MRRIEALLGHIDASCLVIDELHDFAHEFKSGELASRGKDRFAALAVAQFLDSYYTAVETMFLRVSQFFENNLVSEKWHSDLLEKMTITVPGYRPRVISRETYELLRELMRFRHFNRYYLELNFDWVKLDFLLSTRDRVHPKLMSEIAVFRAAVEQIARDAE